MRNFGPGMRDLNDIASPALNLRDGRIYHALAMRWSQRAGDLYTKDSLNIDRDATVYKDR